MGGDNLIIEDKEEMDNDIEMRMIMWRRTNLK